MDVVSKPEAMPLAWKSADVAADVAEERADAVDADVDEMELAIAACLRLAIVTF
jgi:hypothetical protein